MPHRIAIIGAGISGLSAACVLAEAKCEITLFDKSRGLGGRMATRRSPDQISFDHGAQYFTARTPRFQKQLEQWQHLGLIDRWADSGFAICRNGTWEQESSPPQRYVGTPAMTSLAKSLGDQLGSGTCQIRLNQRITNLIPVSDGWQLKTEQGEVAGTWPAVIMALPAEQAADLLPPDDSFAALMRRQSMLPCWATMLQLAADLPVNWPGCFIQDSWLTWAARNHTKPGRQKTPPTLVIHAGAEWTAQHWEHPPETVATLMQEEFWRITGLPNPGIAWQTAHRWKYSIPASAPLRQPNDSNEVQQTPELMAAEQENIDSGLAAWPWQHATQPVVACGDWTLAGRVEGAYLSGQSAAKALLDKLPG